MKKLLSIMLVSLMLIALLTACGAPNNTDTDSQGDETNTDTADTSGGTENVGQENQPLQPTKIICGYYPYVYAGDFLKDTLTDCSDYSNYFYEIFTYDEFCASVEDPSALSPEHFIDNYVLVLRRCHHSSYDEIGMRNYNPQEGSIMVDDMDEVGMGETEDIRLFYYYLLIPRTTKSSLEINGKSNGYLKIKRTYLKQYRAYITEPCETVDNGYIGVFENITEAGEFLTSHGIENIFYWCFDIPKQNKLLAICLNNSLRGYLETGESSFIGFDNLMVDENGDIEITVQRTIVDGYYGESNCLRLCFIEVPSEILENVNSNPQINLNVIDYMVTTYRTAGSDIYYSP